MMLEFILACFVWSARRRAIETARAYAHGHATLAQLNAAWAAARAAARAWQTKRLFEYLNGVRT